MSESTSPIAAGASGPALRSYQARAVARVQTLWQSGARRVCLVSPTGSGKTVIASALAAPFSRVVWVAHRRELVAQACAALGRNGLRVGAICPGLPADPGAPVQVGTIQTLLARDVRPEAELVVLDEAHHYAPAAERFAEFCAAYPNAKILGPTATPERRDGSPLGDVFDEIVVAATYSELIDAGHIVSCDIFAPPTDHTSGGWAIDPVSAYTTHAAGTRCFAFFYRVQRAEEWRDAFNLAGHRAAVISDATHADDRRRILDEFSAGSVRVICNVYTMTEGIDIPSATTCLLARPFSHASGYMQSVGRVLRPANGKPRAILLDLVDASGQHGPPTADRIYSLDGDAMTPVSKSAGRMCPQCGLYPMAYSAPSCPRCGWILPVVPPPTIKIWDVGLRRVYAGANTAGEHKRAECDRLVAFAKRRGWSLSWAVKEYRKLFGDAPSLTHLGDEDRRAEYDRLVATQREKGFKPGFSAARYRDLFGGWPPRTWGQLG